MKHNCKNCGLQKMVNKILNCNHTQAYIKQVVADELAKKEVAKPKVEEPKPKKEPKNESII